MAATKSQVLLPVQNPHAAGIDAGSREHLVCVGSAVEQDVRSFGVFTADLHVLADWLQERGVQTVAVESTGVYWIALFEVL